tara:strand:+ start:1230 stop:2336 length:1107 start_codon:yes stop_codon:yes gene_type:complete
MAERTPLYALHLELGAKMVEFGGYEMPLSYPDGIIREHTQVRSSAGLFDVSHMGQIVVEGPDAATLLESLIPTDLAGLPNGRQRYAYFTTEQGGILDDLMISNLGDHFRLVVNAANKHTVMSHLRSEIGDRCRVDLLTGHGLLALQGPATQQVVNRLSSMLGEQRFMEVTRTTIGELHCLAHRSGYTGEDGFEFSLADADTEPLARLILEQEQVRPAGLGARDSLRLEAGLCLHGNDIGPEITPVEANIAWAIPACRRATGDRSGGFPGADRILSELSDGTGRMRVGIQPEGRAPVRAHASLQLPDGESVGEVTSGGYGPSLARPVAMGYVENAYSSEGTGLQAIVRGKPVPVTVCKLPFVQHRYLKS